MLVVSCRGSSALASGMGGLRSSSLAGQTGHNVVIRLTQLQYDMSKKAAMSLQNDSSFPANLLCFDVLH